MILEWMLYASGLALLLGLAALSLETVVQQRGWPVRALWTAAMLGSALVPVTVAVVGSIQNQGPAQSVAIEGVGAYGEPMEDVGVVPDPIPDLWTLDLWILASLVGLLWFVVSIWRLRRWKASWVLRSLDGRRVWISADTGPAVFGVIRTRIVLPAWVLDRSEADRALILAHEDEHILADDPLLLTAGLLLVTVLPWNLPLWWHWRRLRQAVEVDCDQRVIARGKDVRAYSQLLLEVNTHSSLLPLTIAALSESPTLLERRIRAMMTPRQPRWRMIALGSVVVAAAALTVASSLDPPPALTLPTEVPVEAMARQTSPPIIDEVAPDEVIQPDTPYEVARLDERPRLTNVPEIQANMQRSYPRLMLDAGIGGTTVVRFIVDHEGNVLPGSIAVISSTNDAFAESTTAVTELFQFTPGKYRGRNVSVVIEMPVTWAASQ